MAKTLSVSSLIHNNLTIRIVPNSLMYTEGFGERNVRTQSGGGGDIEVVSSQDAETQFSTLKFSLYPTPENIERARQMAANFDKNVFNIIDEGLTRTFNNATLVNDPEVAIGADTTFELEFKTSKSV